MLKWKQERKPGATEWPTRLIETQYILWNDEKEWFGSLNLLKDDQSWTYSTLYGSGELPCETPFIQAKLVVEKELAKGLTKDIKALKVIEEPTEKMEQPEPVVEPTEVVETKKERKARLKQEVKQAKLDAKKEKVLKAELKKQEKEEKKQARKRG